MPPREAMEALAGQELLCDLPLELDAVGSMLHHGSILRKPGAPVNSFHPSCPPRGAHSNHSGRRQTGRQIIAQSMKRQVTGAFGRGSRGGAGLGGRLRFISVAPISRPVLGRLGQGLTLVSSGFRTIPGSINRENVSLRLEVSATARRLPYHPPEEVHDPARGHSRAEEQRQSHGAPPHRPQPLAPAELLIQPLPVPVFPSRHPSAQDGAEGAAGGKPKAGEGVKGGRSRYPAPSGNPSRPQRAN